MKELTINELKETNGGLVNLFAVAMGAYLLMRWIMKRNC